MVDWEVDDNAIIEHHTNQLGEVFQKLVFEVEATFSGSFIDFSIYHNGQKQGSKSVKVSFDHATGMVNSSSGHP